MFRVSELESELETTREQLETIERLEEHRDREEDILRAREAQLIEIIKELEKANKKGKTAWKQSWESWIRTRKQLVI